LRDKDELCVFEIDHDRVTALLNASFVFKSHWAVTRKSFLLCNYLGTFVLSHNDWHVAFS